jgi:hypothetical protein
VTVRNSIAETDTNKAPCNDLPDGYTWVKLTVDGTVLTRISPDDWDVPPGLFADGRLELCLQDSRAEENVWLEIQPTVAGHIQTTPPMTFHEGEIYSYFVDVTGAFVTRDDSVFLMREYEVLVTARDRYCNTKYIPVPTRFTARFPSEFAPSNSSEIFTGPVDISGETQLSLVSRIQRIPPDQAQWLQAYHATNIMADGRSDPYYVLPHAPEPFALLEMADSTELSINADPDSVITFAWEEAPDPYTDRYRSRFDPRLYSDTVWYSVTIFDNESDSRRMTFDSDGDGLETTLTMTMADFTDMLDRFFPGGVPERQRLFWYVEATDGLYSTKSDIRAASTDLPGRRLLILSILTEAEPPVAVPSVTLEQNYPNPFNPSTTIRFTLPDNSYARLSVYDNFAREVAVLTDAELRAGRHAMQFDGSGLAGGVYNCVLRSGGAVLCRRMVLMK